MEINITEVSEKMPIKKMISYNKKMMQITLSEFPERSN